MGRLILVTGGARSGKSSFAQSFAARLGGESVLFVATAQPRDPEMAQRIEAHRLSRPAAWATLEAPRQVGQAIQSAPPTSVILVDCLTLLVSNVLLALDDGCAAEAVMTDEVVSLLKVGRSRSEALVVVTNEVGLGIVPGNPLARQYRDLLGRGNAFIAAEADEVYLLVAGLPVEIKSLARRGGAP